jgi:Ca2+-binding EF-hand superfamily protein
MDADRDGSKTLDFTEIGKILKELNIKISKDQLKVVFNLFDRDKSGKIEKGEFVTMIKQIMVKPEIFPILKKYCPRFAQEGTRIRSAS